MLLAKYNLKLEITKKSQKSNAIVLNVEDMKRVGPKLGRDVTMREIPNGVHDLFLSPAPARDQALGATLAWLDARFPVSTSTGAPA